LKFGPRAGETPSSQHPNLDSLQVFGFGHPLSKGPSAGVILSQQHPKVVSLQDFCFLLLHILGFFAANTSTMGVVSHTSVLPSGAPLSVVDDQMSNSSVWVLPVNSVVGSVLPGDSVLAGDSVLPVNSVVLSVTPTVSVLPSEELTGDTVLPTASVVPSELPSTSVLIPVVSISSVVTSELPDISVVKTEGASVVLFVVSTS
jgi:hypothetical protein